MEQFRITLINGTIIQSIQAFATHKDAMDYLHQNIESLADLKEYKIISVEN